METVDNTKIDYEELYFVKMLVLMYFLNLGKEQWRMSWSIDFHDFRQI